MEKKKKLMLCVLAAPMDVDIGCFPVACTTKLYIHLYLSIYTHNEHLYTYNKHTNILAYIY